MKDLMQKGRNPLIIDAHCHLGQRLPVEKLIRKMDAAGVDIAVSVGSGGNPFEKLKKNNDYNLKVARKHHERIIPFIYYDPRYEKDGLKEIDRCMDKHGDIIKGIKIGHRFAEARYMFPMMEKAQDNNITVGIHCDSSIRGHPYIIADLANSFPKVNVIMLHTTMANSAATELLQVKVAKKNPNIWFETCFSSPYIIKNIVKQMGADRIIYGSDHSSLVGSSNFPSIYERVEYEMMMQIYYIRCLELPKEQEDMIMGLNAAKLFGVEINDN
jgi:predicted TIM-barrel fold metal-dependent hydrolase